MRERASENWQTPKVGQESLARRKKHLASHGSVDVLKNRAVRRARSASPPKTSLSVSHPWSFLNDDMSAAGGKLPWLEGG